jgi:hypothetical protein
MTMAAAAPTTAIPSSEKMTAFRQLRLGFPWPLTVLWLSVPFWFRDIIRSWIDC